MIITSNGKAYKNYRKIPKINPGPYIFQRLFLRLIFEVAHRQMEISVTKSIGLAYGWKEIFMLLYCFCFVLFCI